MKESGGFFHARRMKVDKEHLWLLVRDILSKLPGEDKWCNNWLWFAVNYNTCHMDGKHPLTSDEEWKVLEEIINKDQLDTDENIYTEEDCKRLFDLLDEKRFELFMKLYYRSKKVAKKVR